MPFLSGECQEGQQPDNLKRRERERESKSRDGMIFFSPLAPSLSPPPPSGYSHACVDLWSLAVLGIWTWKVATSWLLRRPREPSRPFSEKVKQFGRPHVHRLQQRYASAPTPRDLSLALPFIAVPPAPSCRVSTSHTGRRGEMRVRANTLSHCCRLFCSFLFSCRTSLSSILWRGGGGVLKHNV